VLTPLLLLAALHLPTDSTLDALLRRNTEAVGGAAISRVATRRVEAVLTGAAPFDIPVTIEQQRPRLFRREATLPGPVTQVTVLNGLAAWRIDPTQGITAPAPLSDAERAELFEDAVFDGDLTNSGAAITLLGMDSLATGRAYRLSLRYPDGRPVTVWVDSASALEVRRSFTRTVGGQLLPMETDIGDYRAVKGVQEPHRITTRIPAFGVTMTLRMVRVEVNADIPVTRFAPR
jgi:hypothetical protein